jgi:hypothetical protein
MSMTVATFSHRKPAITGMIAPLLINRPGFRGPGETPQFWGAIDLEFPILLASEEN